MRFERPILCFLSVTALGGALLSIGCDKTASNLLTTGDNQTSAPSDDGPKGGDDGSKGGKTGSGDGGSSNPASCPSSYNVIIRGDFSGTGTATVSAGSMQISGTVTNSAGATGTFTATAPVVKQRFNGSGSAMGHAFTFSGRIDPADTSAGPGVLRSARLVATFATKNGRYGRIAGQAGAAKSDS